MTGKKAALLVAALVTVFVSGYYTAAFQFKKLQSEHAKRLSAIARSRDAETLGKEIELLVTFFQRSSGNDEKLRETLCKVMSNKLKQVEEDRAIIVDAGLAGGGEEQNPGLLEAHRIFNSIADRQLEYARNATKQIGCT